MIFACMLRLALLTSSGLNCEVRTRPCLANTFMSLCIACASCPSWACVTLAWISLSASVRTTMVHTMSFPCNSLIPKLQVGELQTHALQSCKGCERVSNTLRSLSSTCPFRMKLFDALSSVTQSTFQDVFFQNYRTSCASKRFRNCGNQMRTCAFVGFRK